MPAVTSNDRPLPVRRAGPRPVPTAPVRTDEAYSLQEFLRRVGWRRSALRVAKAAGMRVIQAGGRAFVLGSDLIAYLDKIGGRP